MRPKSKLVYFDNAIITPAIIEYQKNHDSTLLVPFTGQFIKLIKGIINTHKIYRFWSDHEELVQQGFIIVLEALRRFDAQKGDLFSYLSIAVKQALKNWTLAQNISLNKKMEYKDEIYDDLSFDSNIDIMEQAGATSLNVEEEGICYDIDCAMNQHKINNYQDLVKYLQSKGWKSQQIANCLHVLRTSYERRKGA